MAEVQLTANSPTVGGSTPTVQTGVAAAATDQYFFPAGQGYILRVTNGAGAADMTIVTPATVDGLAVADRTANIPANATRLFGGFRREVYGDENGQVQITFAAADANVILEVIRV